jgi:hypothetical protein
MMFCYGAEVFNPTPNPQPGGRGYPFWFGTLPLTRPSRETLPVAMLPPAYRSGLPDYAKPRNYA